jgi:phosphoglucomutase
MDINLLAGKPADPASLVNVTKLVNAYYTEMPDPSVPGQRVLFGTSRHCSEPIRALKSSSISLPC